MNKPNPEAERRKVIADTWSKGKRALLDIEKDHANHQNSYQKEFRNFLIFQLTITPVVLGLFVSNLNELKNTESLQWGVFLLAVHFVWGLIYHFLRLQGEQVALFQAFKKVYEAGQADLELEEKYLMGRDGVTSDEVIRHWESKWKESKEKQLPKKMVIPTTILLLQLLYTLGITLIAISLINWTSISSALVNFTSVP